MMFSITGYGASVSGTFSVSPGQILLILVGQQPPDIASGSAFPGTDSSRSTTSNFFGYVMNHISTFFIQKLVLYSKIGGGGGSFVGLGPILQTAVPLLAAGGGGGSASATGAVVAGATISNISSTGNGVGLSGGKNGNGGTAALCGGW
jgi:hypothetical protein